MSGKAKDLFESGDDVGSLFDAGEDVTPVRQDWGDAASNGASVQQEPPGQESIASEPYGPAENPHPISLPSALVHQYLAGFWKQGSDEGVGAITAAAQPAGNGAAWRTPDGGTRMLNTTGDVYRAGRDSERDTLRDASEEHPIPSMIANMAGDITSDALLRSVGVPVTSQAYQVGSGALAGLMNSDADLTQPTPESLMQAGEETALGGAAAYAIPMVGRYAGRKIGPYVSRAAETVGDWWDATAAKDWLEQFARERALKASGWIQKDFPKKTDAPAKLERLLGQGQTLLDEPGLIGPFSSKAAIRDRLEPLVDREGRRIGRALDTADAAATGAQWVGATADDVPVSPALAPTPGFNPYAFIADARNEIETPFMQNPSLKAEGRGVRRWLNDLGETANDLEAQGQPFTFRRANEYKGDLQDKVFNPNGTVKANKAAQDELQRAMTQAIDQQAEPLLGAQGLADFRDARRKFGAFKGALDKATEGANRDLGNNFMGLKDMQAAQLAAEAAEKSGGLIGAGVALTSKLARGRGDSLAAYTADGLAKSDWLQSVATTQPEVFGKWAQYLSAAAARSPEALGQLHNTLSETDPEYQQRMRLLGGQEQ